MTDLNDFIKTDSFDHVMAAHVNDLIGASLRSEYSNVETLAATRVLLDVDTPIQRFNCNGADRIVKMPTGNTTSNHPYLIVNATASGAWTLTVQDNAGAVTLATLSPGEVLFSLPDGNGEYVKIYPAGDATSYRISVTVASNNITLALKDANGNDPSPTSPVTVQINGTAREVTAALYVTVNAAVNTFNAGSSELATKEIDYFPMLAWVAASSEVAIGFARIPFGTLGSDFSGTATNEKYAAWAKGSNAAVTVASTDSVAVIGRFAATLSAGAGYTWSVPTFTNNNLIHVPTKKTRTLSWSPVHSRSGTAYTNLPTTAIANYTVDDRKILFFERHTQHGTPGGTGLQRFTMPFTNPFSLTQICPAANNTTAVVFSGYWILSSALLNLLKYDATEEVTASNAYSAEGEFFLT